MRKAFWIWNIKNCEGGDPLKIAAVAHRAGLSDVFVKVADGPLKFGVLNGNDQVPAVVAALRAVGVRVWGWQYVYGNQPENEEKIATQRIHELKLDGFIVDAEGEFKKAGWGARAETYLSRLKQNNPDVTIAFSSYRWPNYHPEFPWAVFYKYCSINMPQVYWLQATNAAYQTEQTFVKFEAMGRDTSRQLPIMPAAPAWKENGWAPTLAQIQDFEAVAAKRGATLVSYWSWEHCRRDLPHLWPADMISPKPPPTIPPGSTEPPPPPPVEQDSRLERLEAKITDLEKALVELSKVLADLKSILK